MASACSRMAETNHLAGGIQKKEFFCFGVRYFFALILLLWGILLESYVNPWFLAKILYKRAEKGIAFLKKRVYN